MDATNQQSQRLRRSMTVLLLVGIILAFVGGIGFVLVGWKVDDLERAYQLDRAFVNSHGGQYAVNVSGSRSIHPANQYLPSGPQVVSYGGPAPGQVRESLKASDRMHINKGQMSIYQGYVLLAQRSIIAGLAMVMITSTVLLFVRWSRIPAVASSKA